MSKICSYLLQLPQKQQWGLLELCFHPQQGARARSLLSGGSEEGLQQLKSSERLRVLVPAHLETPEVVARR